jgi:hypothetical protein
MEEAITKFLDGMEGQERSGFKDLHRFLCRLPLPIAKWDRAMLHSEALEGCFISKMDEEEQKRFTLSELLLYRHALEYRYVQCSYIVHTLHTQAFLFIHCTYFVCTPAFLFMHCTYSVCTQAFLFIYCPYFVYIFHTLYIHCTYIV